MQAILYQMNQEETSEREQREGRYKESQDDVSVIRKELNKLTSAVGELVTAFRGNDLGTEGIISEVRKLVADQLLMEKRFDKLEKRFEGIQGMAKTNQRYIMGFIAAIAAIIGAVGKSFIDHFSKK